MTRSGYRKSQRDDELNAFIELLQERNCRSYLEVGARHGDTFFEVMKSLPKGSRGVSVDLPGGPWGRESSREALEAAAEELRTLGYEIITLWGDSRSMGVRHAAMATSPYDAILIDGDHSFVGVAADWENYGGMAPLVAFHDIDGEGMKTKAGDEVEVPRFWRKLKQAYRTREIIGKERGMGIGVVFR